MIAIALRFPAGRFHATPWERHVNEGVPEWPPSPWKLLRAMVATWKIKTSEFDEQQVRSVLEQMVAPPLFYLPPATTGHTRHYMRWYKKGPEDQTLVFDAFVCLDPSNEIVACWPETELDPHKRRILATLLERLGYLGRAESWCEARLLDTVDGEPNCWPLNGMPPGQDQELVRVLCPDPETAFSDEHVKKTRGKNKRPAYDPAWHLCVETAQLHAEKWSDPPGSQWVTYVRQADCFDPPIKPLSRPPRKKHHIQVVRFALDSSVLPLATETLPVAEAARRYLMGIHGRHTERDGVRGRSEVLSGKDADGKPLDGHGHTFYLPSDEDGDGRLDYLTLIARNGFGTDELRAFDSLRELKTGRKGEERHPLRLLLLGMGTLDDYSPYPVKKSSVWISATPYLATRHAKTRGRHRIDLASSEDKTRFLIADLHSQIAAVRPDLERDLIDQVKITPIPENGSFLVAKRWRPIQFKRIRSKASDDGGRRLAGSFRLEFPIEVPGPIALGHSAHFGMGLFLPE